MSSPSPIPPPNDRRNSRASSNGGLPNEADALSEPSELRVVGGPPSSPSPLALRHSNSPSSKRRKSRCLKVPPEMSALEYTTVPDSNLVCLICHAPFDRPVQLPCEHYFCRECLEHAWAPQASTNRRTCPTCRRPVESENDLRPVPKIIETMLNELVVKCPNTKAGCCWVDHRVNVHDHVMLYCEYTPIECPAADCRLHTTQKDFHKGCLHYTVSCEDCHVSLMKKDLQEHQRNLCLNRTTSCTLCDAVLLRLDLKTHINVCPKHVISCQGAIVGCKFRSERADVIQHELACAMATMAPHFRDQQARLERHEARMEPLARKVGILEDGLTNITNMLYPANANDASFPVSDHLDPNDASAEFRLPPASFAHGTHGSDNSNEPPFDSQVHHLLTLHENLREEVSRIATTLTEVEGRANMMIINESQRNKDEMLHTNAAINNMRMQLHWLMSATIHQRATSASSSTSRPSASTSAGTTNRSTTQGPSSRPGPSGTLPAPYRRLSDSNRQDTKL